MNKKIGLARMTGIACLLMALMGPLAVSCLQAQEKEPDMGIKIILNIYSGRRNPQWWIVPGPEFDKLVQTLKGLQAGDEKRFNYQRWNTLGFSSFWIIAKNVPELPFAVHVWHDEAAVTRRRGETAMQALGAMPVYELLADYTLKTKIAPDKCFQRYLEWRTGRKKK